MRKQLMLLLTLSALLTYRPGHAQAGSGESPTLVASTRPKTTPTRTVIDPTATKTTVTAKKETVAARQSQKSISRIWSRIMGYCHDVHTASKKKS